MLNTEALFHWLSEEGLDPEWMEDDTEIALCCPQCGDDRPRLYVSADHGAWYCFHCGQAGNLTDLLKAFTHDFDEAFELKRKFWTEEDDHGPFAPATRPKAKSLAAVSLPPEFRPITPAAPQHFVKYLAKRRVSLELAQARGIGYCETGKYRHRIIVPAAHDGVLYTFVARTTLAKCPSCYGSIGGTCYCKRPIPKVLYADGGHPSLTLFNLEAVRMAGRGRLVVMEGVFDALRIPDEAVALLGSSPSPTQISLLVGLAGGRDVVVCLDGDSAGRAGAVKVADELASAMVPVRVAHLPDGADPGSMKRAELEEVLTTAEKYVVQ